MSHNPSEKLKPPFAILEKDVYNDLITAAGQDNDWTGHLRPGAFHAVAPDMANARKRFLPVRHRAVNPDRLLCRWPLTRGLSK
jgi:hypothetical protein